MEVTENGNQKWPVIFKKDDHIISNSDIDPDALGIIGRLRANGAKAYIVGGGVRDLLLGKKPKDFDIATDATPNQIKRLFRNCRIIGRRFKLVHVFFANRKNIEVATFRDAQQAVDETSGDLSEISPNARDNVYGTEECDALRRDLTINGLFYDPFTGAIIDYVGGMEDLRFGRVRVIGDPDVRFAEDPVRLIRVVRHAVKTNFQIESRCWDSLCRNHHLIEKSVPVRVYEEIKKDFVSGYWTNILKVLDQGNIIDHLIPELHQFNLLSPESGLLNNLSSADELILAGEPISVAAVLSVMALHICGLNSGGSCANRPDPDGAFSRLVVPRKEREKIDGILKTWVKLTDPSVQSLKLSGLTRRPFAEDLHAFVRIMSATGEWQDIASVVEDVFRGYQAEPADRPHKRHRTRSSPHRQIDTRRHGGRHSGAPHRRQPVARKP